MEMFFDLEIGKEYNERIRMVWRYDHEKVTTGPRC
jgi:hypothetical protein